MVRQQAFYMPWFANLESSEHLTDHERLLTFTRDAGPLGHEPGQFLQVSVLGVGEAPLSVCSAPREQAFQVCVTDKGHVSHALHKLGPGDKVGMRGPYGQGFPVGRFAGGDVLLVAGGVGMAPLRCLLGSLLSRREDYGRIILVYGARNPGCLLFKKDLDAWGRSGEVEVHCIVDHADDTWTGPEGVVTDPLADLELDPENTRVAMVGPPAVFRFAGAALLERGISGNDIYLSLERRFQCGIGKCGHCQLNDLYICRDGPVFSWSFLKNRPEATELGQ
ncbi:MAG: FAD/NAD(P)-binding protein [Deltaproteobacteria bacterium]|nr:FAD/NAD(P)-binding protein [Deltaproteobacteria bacterium]